MDDLSPRSYAPGIISVLVVLGFFVVLFIWIYTPIDLTERGMTVLNNLVGALTLAFGQVIQYWLGSSATSRNKDQALQRIAEQKGTTP